MILWFILDKLIWVILIILLFHHKSFPSSFVLTFWHLYGNLSYHSQPLICNTIQIKTFKSPVTSTPLICLVVLLRHCCRQKSIFPECHLSSFQYSRFKFCALQKITDFISSLQEIPFLTQTHSSIPYRFYSLDILTVKTETELNNYSGYSLWSSHIIHQVRDEVTLVKFSV